jgi:hypothetical protein
MDCCGDLRCCALFLPRYPTNARGRRHNRGFCLRAYGFGRAWIMNGGTVLMMLALAFQAGGLPSPILGRRDSPASRSWSWSRGGGDLVLKSRATTKSRLGIVKASAPGSAFGDGLSKLPAVAQPGSVPLWIGRTFYHLS